MADLPEWLTPMAATLTEQRFTDPGWLFERKVDGIRLLAFKGLEQVRLYSRTRRPQAIPAIAAAIARLPVEQAVLDGELTWDASEYHVFDVMWLDGRDLRELPLDARHAELDLLPLAAPLHRVELLDDARPWERARAEGWEGVVCKRRDSRYEGRRSPLWLKMKCEAAQELVVGGFTDPRGKRVGLGALLLGHHQGDDFVFAGKVGTGFDDRTLLALRRQLDALERPSPPFTRAIGLPRKGAHFVEPEVVVQVAFLSWTGSGKLRHPRLIGIRDDKPARDVVREGLVPRDARPRGSV